MAQIELFPGEFAEITPLSEPCTTCSTLQERLLTLEHVIRQVLPEDQMNAVGLDVDPSGKSLIEAAKKAVRQVNSFDDLYQLFKQILIEDLVVSSDELLNVATLVDVKGETDGR